ncbi:MAG: cation transporter [Deltaproteobacteria bacterium]|nr:cation transporter [Deltaproteobacteria bacterium]
MSDHGADHDRDPAHGTTAHAHAHDAERAEEPWACRVPEGAAPRRLRERRRLRWALAITAAAMVGEAVGGWLVGSLALLSDAGHMLTHAFALGVSLVAVVLAGRAATSERTFGLHRVEILAALLNGVTLLAATVWIAWEAVARFRAPEPILGTPMLVVAVVGLAVNLVTAWLLHDVGKRDLNVRSAFLHLLGDTVSSVAVVLGALIIGRTGWLWIDPALSLGIAVLILVWSAGLIRDAVRVLLEAVPYGISVDNLRRSVRECFPAVEGLDDVHVWSVTSGMVAMTARVRTTLESLDDCCRLAERLEEHLRVEFGIGHATLQFVRAPRSPETGEDREFAAPRAR